MRAVGGTRGNGIYVKEGGSRVAIITTKTSNNKSNKRGPTRRVGDVRLGSQGRNEYKLHVMNDKSYRKDTMESITLCVNFKIKF